MTSVGIKLQKNTIIMIDKGVMKGCRIIGK